MSSRPHSSRARQYALVGLAQALGWPAERVLLIDEDQGQSGTRADNRSGFQRLLAEVALFRAGALTLRDDLPEPGE